MKILTIYLEKAAKAIIARNNGKKIKKLFLYFCDKNGLRVEDFDGVLSAYIPKPYFPVNSKNDEISFMEYRDYNNCICFETCIDCYYDAFNDYLTIEFDYCNSRNIYNVKDFKLIEETYKNIMKKLEFFSFLIKEMKINERKKEIEKDFKYGSNI